MTAQTQRYDAQRALNAPTIPKCARCTRQRVLFGGVCGACLAIEEREELAADDALDGGYRG